MTSVLGDFFGKPFSRFAAVYGPIVLTPLLLLIMGMTVAHLHDSTNQASSALLLLARSAASEEGGGLARGYRLLTLIGSPALSEPTPRRCARFLARELDRFHAYANFGLLKQGRIFCTAHPVTASLALQVAARAASGHPWAFLRGSGIGQQEIVFGLPIPQSSGMPAGSVFGTLDMGGRLARLASRLGDGPVSMTLLSDESAPEALDGRMPALRAAEAGRASLVRIALPHRRDWLFALAPMLGVPLPGVYFAVGIPAPRRVMWTEIGLALESILLGLALGVWVTAGGIPTARAWFVRARGRRPGAVRMRIVVRARRALRRLRRFRPLKSRPTPADLRRANRTLQRVLKETRRGAREAQALSTLSELLQSAAQYRDVGEVVAQAASRLMPAARGGALFMLAAGARRFQLISRWGHADDLQPPCAPDACGAIRCANTSFAEGGSAPMCRNPGRSAHHVLCVPLVAHGQPIGVLHIDCAQPSGLKRSRERARRATWKMAEALAVRTALALANIRLREEWRMRSYVDALTGLYNRRFLEETLASYERRTLQDRSVMGVILIDIDHFKRFNDTYGHDAGDALLRGFGRFLREQIRAGDLACRFGGEEFMVVMPGTDARAAFDRAERIRQAAADLQVVHGTAALGPVTVSLGVAALPTHGRTWQDVFRSADSALYQAKRAGRNQVAAAGQAERVGGRRVGS
ncbi:MAG: sensor domain-containing diguanylate cyclase [Betaproteobacteria bacterium]|nr:sensor domain-containing diguanylate cyclase [Betaproteobacteria bacterium]